MSSTTTQSSTTAASAAAPTADPTLTVATLVQLCICFPGLIVNSFLVFVILRNRKLRTGCCFILILLLAICDCLAEFSLITTPTTLYLGNITIPLLTCFSILLYSGYAQQNVAVLMLSIGVDRLLSVLFPNCYKKNIAIYHKWKYMFVLLAVPSVPNFFIVYQWYLYSSAEALKQVFCFPIDIVGPVAVVYGGHFHMIYNGATFLIYSTIWLLFKFKSLLKALKEWH